MQHYVTQISHYLNLYQKNKIHGEFLIDFIANQLRKGDKNLDHNSKKAIEYFLAKNETYESDPAIRKAEKHLTGDKELLQHVIVLQKTLTGEKRKINFVPKSISEEKNLGEVLLKYIELYQNKNLDEEDFLLFLWIFLMGRYISIDCLMNDLATPKTLKNFKKIQKLHEEKSYIELSREDKKYVIDSILSLKHVKPVD